MTDNRTTELLPCPFCGGKAALRTSWMGDGHRYRAVECVECGATTPGNYSEVGDQSAWDWNARTEQAIAATLGEKPRDKTEEWLLNACNRAAQDYVAQLEQERDELKQLVRDLIPFVCADDGIEGIEARMKELGIEVIDE